MAAPAKHFWSHCEGGGVGVGGCCDAFPGQTAFPSGSSSHEEAKQACDRIVWRAAAVKTHRRFPVDAPAASPRRNCECLQRGTNGSMTSADVYAVKKKQQLKPDFRESHEHWILQNICIGTPGRCRKLTGVEIYSLTDMIAVQVAARHLLPSCGF